MPETTEFPQIPTLHVTEIELPREFGRLYDLAYNLWWTWTPEAGDLFAAIDPTHWAQYRNPVQMLLNVTARRWYPLLESESFRHLYERVIADFDDYMGGQDTWFLQAHGSESIDPVAYFSMEYGLHQSLAVYSGGLGVLSGDHCKSISDLGIPFVAVGLLYRHGYFQQTIDSDGFQQHTYPDYDFSRLPLRPVSDGRGQSILISVPFPGREVLARVWLAQVGRIPLLLLDSDIPENDPSDRPICNQLYVGGREMRLVQEILLGRGGVRVLEELGIEPSVWHLNEGHSAFLQLERLRSVRRERDCDLDTAREIIRANSVFTTHTPVPAGNEQFDADLVVKYMREISDEIELGVDGLLDLGRAREGEGAFNLTALAIKTSSYQNGVSRLNGQVASQMWRHLYPDGTEEPIEGITNGIHSATWAGREMQELFERHIGRDWQRRLLDPASWDAVHDIPDARVWNAHEAQKRRLGRFTRSRLLNQLARHGSSPDDLRAVGALFDERALTIGFARRFATYKRASLVFSDLDRLRSVVENTDRPVQFLFAGKAHPADRPGQELVQRIFRLTRESGLKGRIFFLENYDMRMGRMLVQGVDVWLNTPRRPMEASGTSGQKAALNGALNFSILDGWWPEGWNGENGWVIGGSEEDGDDAQDGADVASLYDTLENEIVPLFFDRDEDGVPAGWVRRMKESIRTLTPAFAANRMVRDYLERGYLPAARRSKA